MNRILLAGAASLAMTTAASVAFAGGLAPPIQPMVQGQTLSLVDGNCPVIPAATASLRSQGYTVMQITTDGNMAEFDAMRAGGAMESIMFQCATGAVLGFSENRGGGNSPDGRFEETNTDRGNGTPPGTPGRPSNPGEEQPGEEQPGEEQPGEEQPGEEKPGEEQPGEEQPGEEQPGEEKPGEEKPGEEQPGEGSMPLPDRGNSGEACGNNKGEREADENGSAGGGDNCGHGNNTDGNDEDNPNGGGNNPGKGGLNRLDRSDD